MKIYKFVPKYFGEQYTVLAKDKEQAHSFIYEHLCKKHKKEPTEYSYNKLCEWMFLIELNDIDKHLYEIQEIKIGQVIEE